VAIVSVATWNLHQGFDRRTTNIDATWRYLEEEIKPTVALLQEVDRRSIRQGKLASPAGQTSFETAVVGYGVNLEEVPDVLTRHSKEITFPVRSTASGTFVAARVVAPTDGLEPFVAISAYGQMAPIYAQVSVLHAIADLIPLFDSPLGRRVVLGGDLNVFDQAPDKLTRTRWTAILGALESLGLVNLLKLTQPDRGPLPGCPCRQVDCWHVETFRHRRNASGRAGYWTADYMFATQDLAERLVRPLEVWNDRPEDWALSDHCPLVARFEL
jgi:endonuclease/exonuclease/phosphatase family metal-dependent hydrolase